MKSKVDARLINTSLLKKCWDVQTDPLSNTGSNSQLSPQSGWCSRVDNLTVIWTGKARIVESVCANFFDIRFGWDAPVGRKIGVYWDRTWVSECGALLCERDIGDGRVCARLALGGKICSSVGTLKLRGFALWCRANLPLLRVTRLDIAVDDFDKHVKPEQIIDALQSQEYTGFKKADVVVNHDKKWGGWCLYLGRRESDKLVRYYDKRAESRGEIDSYRWELEAHDEYAHAIFDLWCECTQSEHEIQHLLVNCAIGQLGFIDKSDKNVKRCKDLGWWAEFKEYLCSSPIKIRVARIKTSVERKIEWLRRSVGKSLAVISDAVGECRLMDLVSDTIELARQRYTDYDRLAIEKYLKLIDS